MLASIGKDCHLLIHECTFEDGFHAEAKLKKHSTISEALRVSEQMNARTTIFTHFSIRYKYITRIDEIIENQQKTSHTRNVGVAFDFMKCGPDNFEQLNDMLTEMKVVFREDIDTVEYRRSKKLKLN